MNSFNGVREKKAGCGAEANACKRSQIAGGEKIRQKKSLDREVV